MEDRWYHKVYSKNRYELWYQIEYTHSRKGEKLEKPHWFWLYYGRYGTYDGALEAMRTNGKYIKRWEGTNCNMGKIRDSNDGSVSFFDI